MWGERGKGEEAGSPLLHSLYNHYTCTKWVLQTATASMEYSNSVALDTHSAHVLKSAGQASAEPACS